MNLFSLSGLIIGLFCFIIGTLTIVKAKKSTHFIWALFSFSVSFWGFGCYKIANSIDITQAVFWWKTAYISVILIPTLLTHFIFRFLKVEKTWFLYVVYTIAILLMEANIFSNLFIFDVRYVFSQFYYLSNPTILYNFFVIWFFGLVIYCHYLLIKAYFNNYGLIKHQIKYIFLATIIGFTGGAFAFLPVYEIDVYPILNIAIAVSPFIVAYAIFRYRLMDMRLVARQVYILLLSASFLYVIFYGTVFIENKLFGGVYMKDALISGVVFAILFSVLYNLFVRYVNRTADEYLFSGVYNYRETLNRLTDDLSDYIDLNTVIDLIVDTIKKTIQLDKAGVFLIDTDSTDSVPCHYKIAKNIGFKDNDVVLLVEDVFLNDFLIKTQKPLVCDELAMLSRDARNSEEKNHFMRLYDYMNDIEATICLPLISNKKLSGIIVLGSKISGDAYTKEDLELLNTLSKQAGITIDNARLYKEVRDFNSTLKQKVDEQTKDIKEKADRLEKTLKIKSEFIYLMSHQLRTPISVIVGMASMLKDGDLENVPIEKKKEFVDGIYMKSKKLADILNDFIKAESMDGESFDFDSKKIEKVNMGDVVKSVCDEFTVEIKEKNINLEFEAVSDPLQITTDPRYLKQAIASIVNNAIKYTQKGFIKVKVYSENNRAICEISDSGIGIPKDDQVKLFHKFVRAKNAVDAYAYGTGLGLFMVKKIVEAHNGGKVDFISEEDKGTTFKISIPIVL